MMRCKSCQTVVLGEFSIGELAHRLHSAPAVNGRDLFSCSDAPAWECRLGRSSGPRRWSVAWDEAPTLERGS